MCGGKLTRIFSLALLLNAAACGAQQESRDSTDPAARRARYDALAARESEIADWLALRAAALIPDSATRATRYAAMRLAVARDRIPWVEAQARERFGDTSGAIAAYSALGAQVMVWRLRDAAARTQVAHDSVRHELLTYIQTTDGGGAVRDGVTLFDKIVPAPTPEAQLTIARAAANVGQWGRARIGYAASVDRIALTAADRFAYAMSLAQANQDAKAAEQYARVHGTAPLTAAAAYQRARALIATGKTPAARTALRTITKQFPKDTSAAAALALLADLATDDLDDQQARTLLQQVARRFPTTRFAAPARFNAALLAFLLGDDKSAAAELASLAASPAEFAAQYWLGRVRMHAGDSAAARTLWRLLRQRDSTSYYAVLASRHLDERNVGDMPYEGNYPRVASVDSAVRRIVVLHQEGMEPEIRWENERLYRDASLSRDRLLATAAAFAGTDQSGRAIALGRRALTDYGPNAAIFHLMYPIVARDTLTAQSQANGIDPILVAGLIRQESNFNPSAISPVGARGLMQLMPSVAKSIAAGKGMRGWSAEQLYDPGVNITLGVAHLAPLLKSQPDVVRALAAYNAGESRVRRWAQKRGADDPELFTERIPFAETRDYVKSILRNREMYRALYRWP